MNPELLDTQVNPAVWEISGHIVLKRKKDYDEASEGNAWRLLAEVSLSEERFQEVNDLIFEAIASVGNGENVTPSMAEEPDKKPQPEEDVAEVKQSSRPAMMVPQECVVLQ